MIGPDALTHLTHFLTSSRKNGFLATTLENASDASGASDDEAAERDAIQNEAAYAKPQTIPHAIMVAGLIATARWPR